MTFRDRPILMYSAFAVALALLFLITATGATQVTTHPNLTGKWRMNPELSEDARTKLESAFGGESTVGQRGGYPNANGHARGREREQMRRRESFIEARESLSIKQTEKEVTVTEGNLRERQFYTDGRPYETEDQRGIRITMKAQWHGDRLVVQTKLASGAKFTETYELGLGRRQLVVTTRSQDMRLKQPLVIRRVYDAVISE